ncbi:MAG: tRNA-dihydrouridine synthase [Nannocystales bacterium]
MTSLASPLSLRCGATLPHRVALAPLTNLQSNSDGTLHEDEFRWLTRRAGSFSLVSTCAAYVSDEGKAWDGQLGIAGKQHEPGLARLATAIGETDSLGLVQLHHAGAKATEAEVKLSTEDDAEAGVRGATPSDLERVTDAFVAAARRAERAGFAGVEVHGANGYLFTQFLAPLDNKRTDEYGGDLDGRARFLRETMHAVRASTSSSFIVGVRISPVDTWDRRGLTLADARPLVASLAEDGADYVHLSLRDAAGSAPFEDSAQPVVTQLREALPSEVALLAAGGVWTRADAQAVRECGADVVVVGRAAIAHPDWPSDIDDPSFSPKRPPWGPQMLRNAAVGADLLTYLERFPGMVEGGTPARS